MGRPKAWLRLGSETLLQRVVRRLEPVASPLVVVAAEGQDLPDLAGKARVVRDRVPGQGPLEALRTGLEALDGSGGVGLCVRGGFALSGTRLGADARPPEAGA